MLTVYHAAGSVCAQKVRLALAEKNLAWESRLLDLAKGEQQSPEYLALNPEGVVPTMVHDGFVLRESSVIIAYLDGLGDGPRLMPAEPRARATTQFWLLRTVAIHEAVNSLSFATYIREMERRRLDADGIEAWIARIPNPQIRAKRRDLMENGPESVYVDGALRVLDVTLRDMHAALVRHSHLAGDIYGLADIAITAYVDRLDRLAMDGLWRVRYPAVSPWLARMRERDSYRRAIVDFLPEGLAEAQRAAGQQAWPSISKRLT